MSVITIENIKGYLQSWYYITLLYGKTRYYWQTWYSTTPNIDKITDRIYLGDIATAFNKDELQKRGITHIISCILGVNPVFETDFEYKNIHLRDIPSENIDVYFNECNAYLDQIFEEDENNKVFIHCICGVSRSATILTAYLMRKNNWSRDETIEYLQSKRSVVDPNDGFRKQLSIYEETLKTKKL